MINAVCAVSQLVECYTLIEGFVDQDPPLAESLCCVIEQDAFPRLSIGSTHRKSSNMAEKLLTGK